MNKETLRKTGATLLCVVAVIIIMGGIFRGADKKIIGKWEIDPGKKDTKVYEFYDDNTGVDYYNLTDGGTYNAESFGYKLNGDTVTIDYGLVSRVYKYEVSSNKLLMDNKLYTKTGSFSGNGVGKYVIAVILFILAACLYGLKPSTVRKAVPASKVETKRPTSVPREKDIKPAKVPAEEKKGDWFKFAGDL